MNIMKLTNITFAMTVADGCALKFRTANKELDLNRSTTAYRCCWIYAEIKLINHTFGFLFSYNL
jgi:hypothetical protein